MRRTIVSVCGLFVLLAGPAWGKAKPSEQELAAITARGTLLAEYDQAAWHATDAVLALNPARERVKRFVARKTPAGWVVDFGWLEDAQSKFMVAYEATQTDAPTHFVVKTFNPAQEDAGFDLVAARAIAVALADFKGESRPYNVAALPTDTGGMYVYVNPAQVKEGVYPYGGAVRYLMSADGTKIVETHRMHKAILEWVPDGGPTKTTAFAGYHSDIFDDRPEDTDVFLVLSREPKVPEYVIAQGHMFLIAVDGSIKVAK